MDNTTNTFTAEPAAPKVSAEEIMQFHRIAHRAHFLALKRDRYITRYALAPCLRKFHEDQPLDLDRLEHADDDAFAREVFGIEAYQEAAPKDNGFRSQFQRPVRK